jgi:hypothetical protein
LTNRKTDLFVIDIGVLLFANVTVGFSGRTLVMSFGACGQGAVVGTVFAVSQIEPFADDDVSVRGPVPSR